jgi:ribonuclease HI
VLFVLAIDLLYRAAARDPDLPGVQLSADVRVVLAGYADDTEAYLSHPREEPALLSLLDEFGSALGLRVNRSKSMVVSCHKAGPTHEHAQMVLPILPVDHHHRLLGVDIASAPVPAHIWAHTLQQLRATLHLAALKTTDVLQRARIGAAMILPKISFIARHVWPSADTVDMLQRFAHNYVWSGSTTTAGKTARAWLRADVAALKLNEGGIGAPDVRATLLRLSERVAERWAAADSPVSAAVGAVLLRQAPTSSSHRSAGIVRLPQAPVRLGPTLASTGLARVRHKLTLPRLDDERTATRELLCLVGRDGRRAKKWEDGWLLCDYTHRSAQLGELRRLQRTRYGHFSVTCLLAAAVTGAGILLTSTGQDLQRRDFPALLATGDRVGDVVELQWHGDHQVRFFRKKASFPLCPRTAIQFQRFCDTLVYNYPAVLLPHNPAGFLQPRPPTEARWRVAPTPEGPHLWLDEGVGSDTDLGVVTSKRAAARAARSAGHAVVTFDPHPWLDPFAQLWNLSTPHALASTDERTPSPAATHVRERESMGQAASAAIGSALARLSWKRIARLKASISNQRLLLFKTKGLRLSGWARVLNARRCPHCPDVGTQGGDTFHIMWFCPAAQAVWALLLQLWQRLGIWRHALSVADSSYLTAVFSVRLPFTPAGAVSFARHPRVQVGRDELHALMQSVWERHVLAGFQTIWNWRHGSGDADIPWTYPTARSAYQGRLVDSLTAAATALPASHPGADTLRQLPLHCRRCALAHARPTAAPSLPTDAYVLFFDSGSRGNPGPGGAGAVVLRTSCLRDNPQLVWSAAMSLAAPTTNNNQAEYVGLVTGLAAAERHNWRPLEVVGDSLLIVRQLAQYHPPKSKRLAAFYRTARHLADRIGVERWIYHLRAYNKMADTAANVAMDGQRSIQTLHPSPRPEWAGLSEFLHSDFHHWRSASSRDRL